MEVDVLLDGELVAAMVTLNVFVLGAVWLAPCVGVIASESSSSEAEKIAAVDTVTSF